MYVALRQVETCKGSTRQLLVKGHVVKSVGGKVNSIVSFKDGIESSNPSKQYSEGSDLVS